MAKDPGELLAHEFAFSSHSSFAPLAFLPILSLSPLLPSSSLLNISSPFWSLQVTLKNAKAAQDAMLGYISF